MNGGNNKTKQNNQFAVQAIFVWKVRFDAACVMEYDLEIDERV